MNKEVNHYDPKTFIYTHTSHVSLTAGYKEPLAPQCSSFAVLPSYDQTTHILKFDVKKDDWNAIQKHKKITAYHKQTLQPKCFDDKSLITIDYTSLKPLTDFDEWLDTRWVTNEQRKYESDMASVIFVRSSKYAQIVDRLRAEAAMMRRNGDDSGALLNEQHADAWYARIKEENPFPTAP